MKNENLHSAMRAYVEAAIEFVAGRAKQAADSSGSEELTFTGFTRATQVISLRYPNTRVVLSNSLVTVRSANI